MLTREQVYKNKCEFFSLLSTLNIDLTNFAKYLDEVNFYEQPATAQATFGGCYAGGLCEYSLNLYYELKNLCGAYYPGKYTEADIILVGLLSNLYKAELYEYYTRNVKNEQTGNWETQGAFRVKENRVSFGSVGLSSFMRAKLFFNLTDEQALAIIYSSDQNLIDGHKIKVDFPLVNMVQMATSVVNYVIN